MADYPKPAKPIRITSQDSLNRAINEAEGDEDLKSIKKRLSRRGYSIPEGIE